MRTLLDFHVSEDLCGDFVVFTAGRTYEFAYITEVKQFMEDVWFLEDDWERIDNKWGQRLVHVEKETANG